MNPQDPLAQLQDIHLPAAVGFWPPAVGWWILLILIIAIIGTIIFLAKRKKSRNAYRALALTEIKTINRDLSESQHAEYLQAVSILLRRTALSGFGSLFNASLKGEAWLEWLDAQCTKTNGGFSKGAGRALLIGPYQKNPEFDRPALQKLSELWIVEHRNQWQQKAAKKNSSEENKKGKKISDKKGAAHHV